MGSFEPAGPLHSYLRGLGCDGRGRRVEDVLSMDDKALEAVHDYIQWLFPLPTRSMAQPGAPILSAPEIDAIRQDLQARANLQKAAERMASFYGRTAYWLSRNDHNHLRITRILRSLRMLVGPEAARSFHEEIMARHRAAGSPVNPDNLKYWTQALEDD